MTQFAASLRKNNVITEEGENIRKPIVKYKLDEDSTDRTSDDVSREGSQSLNQMTEPD